jgi:hypothetical protein
MNSGTSVKFATPGTTLVWKLIGKTLIGLSGDGTLEINLDRDRMQTRLCAISNRDYTDPERAELPAGIDTESPCEGG